MVVLVVILIGSFFGTICMHGSFQNTSCGMIYASFGGYFNWQFSWHHLHAWQIPEKFLWQWSLAVLVTVSISSFFGTICMHGSFQNSSCGNDLWQFWWLFQLAVSLAPFACMAVSRTIHVAMISGSFGGCFNWHFVWHHLHAWQFPEQFMWQWSMTVLVVVSIGSFFGTIYMHSSF